MSRNAKILSVAAYAPDRVVSNAWFDEQLGENVSDWLENVAQIYERRWCTEDESTADLAERAGHLALERAGIQPQDLDLIIIATDTPEFVSPSTASVVQHRLGASKAGVFDLNTACAGFVTAVDTAASFIRSQPRYRYVLVVGAYAMSKFLNLEDKKTVTLFADGAGAVVLGVSESEAQGYLASRLWAMGQYHDGMGIYAGGTNQPVTEQALASKQHLLQFVYRFPKTLNEEEWSKMVELLCEDAGVAVADIDHFIFTQININTIWATMDRLGQPHEKAATVMEKFGYTGSACIPMAFNQLWEAEQVQPGDLIALVGSGGGLAFAGALFRM